MTSYHHILVDAKTEYTKQLVDMLYPRIYEGIKSIYDRSISNADKRGSTQYLKEFQTFLSDIPKWTKEVINGEYKRIILKSECDWLDELITAVFVSHTKVLTSIKRTKENRTLELNVPNSEHFIHKCYIETARQFWKRPDLMYHNISQIEIHRNAHKSEKLISEIIKNTIRKLLPVKNILKEYLGDDYEDDIDDDISLQMSIYEKKNLEKLVKKEMEHSIEKNENVDDNYSNYKIDTTVNHFAGCTHNIFSRGLRLQNTLF